MYTYNQYSTMKRNSRGTINTDERQKMYDTIEIS